MLFAFYINYKAEIKFRYSLYNYKIIVNLLLQINRKLMRKLLFVFAVIYCFGYSVFSQNKYWVFFKDKDGTNFNPYEYFDSKAIERRLKLNLSLYDYTDFPVNESYITQVSGIVDSVSKITRWFNAVSVYAEESQIKNVIRLPFVSSVEPVVIYKTPSLCEYTDNDNPVPDEPELLVKQTERMGGKYFKEKSVDGKGVRIAIFDVGFKGADTIDAFKHIRDSSRIIKTWDFVKNKEFVYGFGTHGTYVMSCIGGITEGKNIGLATGAEFLLARTERNNSEPYSEEENWLAAVEWADKNGADIISSSLGYTCNRYFPEQMDGKHSLVASAANLAAGKGILVVNAAGNDGDNNWHKLSTPGDADSVLTVGGINPETDYHIKYSSYGPTADKRLKPNVSAYAHVMAAGPDNKVNPIDGTSFSTPLVSGFAACAWQLNRNLTNMELLHEIEKSGHLYPYFDYAHGFGIPQAEYFVNGNKKPEVKPTFDFVTKRDTVKVIVRNKYIIKSDDTETLLLYYNIENEKGVLDKYYVISVYEDEVLAIRKKKLRNKKLNVSFKGYTESYTE